MLPVCGPRASVAGIVWSVHSKYLNQRMGGLEGGSEPLVFCMLAGAMPGQPSSGFAGAWEAFIYFLSMEPLRRGLKRDSRDRRMAGVETSWSCPSSRFRLNLQEANLQPP